MQVCGHSCALQKLALSVCDLFCEVLCRYIASVGEKVTKRQLLQMAEGTEIDGAICTPISVEIVTEAMEVNGTRHKERLRLVVGEGRNREVRRIIEAVGLTVTALKRVRIGSMRLPRELGLGQFKVLSEFEAKKIIGKET